MNTNTDTPQPATPLPQIYQCEGTRIFSGSDTICRILPAYFGTGEAIAKSFVHACNSLPALIRERYELRARLGEAMRLLGGVIKSASPNPSEHPTMFAAFDEARAFLANTPTAGNQ